MWRRLLPGYAARGVGNARGRVSVPRRTALREAQGALREAQVFGGLLPFLGAALPEAAQQQQQQLARQQPNPSGPAAAPPGPAAEAGAAEAAGAGPTRAGAATHVHLLDEQLEAKLRRQAAEIARQQQVRGCTWAGGQRAHVARCGRMRRRKRTTWGTQMAACDVRGPCGFGANRVPTRLGGEGERCIDASRRARAAVAGKA